MATFGERLRQLRQQRGLLQQELADRVGVSQGAVARWENDTLDVSLRSARRLAAFFGLTLDELLQQVDEEPTAGDDEASE